VLSRAADGTVVIVLHLTGVLERGDLEHWFAHFSLSQSRERRDW
jgi:hypothetical protein